MALAECTFDTGGIGITANVANAGVNGPPALSDVEGYAANATLFGESASRIVVSAPRERVDGVLSAATAAGVTAVEIGATGGNRIQIGVDGTPAIDTAVAAAEQAWATAIEKKMQTRS